MIIKSDTNLDIEQEFKVEAGPGSGKTNFLVNHINNVMKNSDRLYSTRKIACITFTNTAVETILQRLGKGTSLKTEVSTIHSFLYNNIVKPYSSFIPKEYDVCTEKIDGHDDPTVNGSYVNAWLEEDEFKILKYPNTVKQLLKLPAQSAALKNWLVSAKCVVKSQKIDWELDDTKAVEYKQESSIGITKSNLKILKQHFVEYKKIYWKKGKLDHEDILFFSGILIKEYPFILTVLRAKYPYFFIDEFQDTNPIQSYIINEIRKKESVIGVIGDKAQAIYGFQGAEVELFNKFKINKNYLYTILENHRCDKKIVDFLNIIRNDLSQNACEKYPDALIKLYIGERNIAFENAKNICGREKLVSLSRDNITSNAMKNKLEGSGYDKKLFRKLEDSDSNRDRRNYIISFVNAIELARNSKFKEAIKKIEWLYRKEAEPKKIALKMLMRFMKLYSSYSCDNMMKFYTIMKENEQVLTISNFRKGNAKDFYENTSYMDMAICVNIVEDTSNHITIHKAKGAEYDNVFVVGNKEFLKFLLTPNLIENEEHRIYYVALSRARKRLFLYLDKLTDSDEKKILDMFSLEIERF